MPSRKPQTFQEVLAAAIADLVESGYDSAERIERWMRELRLAAERSLISAASLEQQLRDGLAAVYRRMVDQGGALRYNPGVERFTLEKLRPALRSELDRRILASANLIKLNRAQAIDKTLQRFQGWSTSIPKGGVSGESRAEVKANVRKSLASLPFEERRVLIDQGHKLTAAISEIIAADGGAIAANWVSHYTQAGYDFREDHKERDYRQTGQPFLVRDSWAHRAGLVKKGKIGYYDEVTAVGQEPFCRCYVTWLYALRDLPPEMLTAKGKAALASVRGGEEVRSARQARADSAGPEVAPKIGPEAERYRLQKMVDGLKRDYAKIYGAPPVA
jgi:hypothetical protein